MLAPSQLNLSTSTPPSPLPNRPRPTPSIESLEDFDLNNSIEIQPLGYRKSSLKLEKTILFINYLDVRIRDYTID